LDSIALGKGKGTAEQRLQYVRGIKTVLSLGYASNKLPFKPVHHQGTYEVPDSHLRTFSASSRVPHLIPGELLSVTEQDSLFEDLLKEHVDPMEQPKLLKELIHQVKDNKLLIDHGNVARTSRINGSEKQQHGRS
jgi:hypothetical protein